MPVVTGCGPLKIVYWFSDECGKEPIHLYVALNGNPEKADKYWLSRDGYFVPDRGNKTLSRRLTAPVVDAFRGLDGIPDLEKKWLEKFGSIKYFDED